MTFYVDNLAYYGAVSYVLTFVGDGTVVKSGKASTGAESISVTLTTTERNTLGTDAVYAQITFSSGGNDYSSNIIKLSQEELFDDRIVRTSFEIGYDIKALALQNRNITEAYRSLHVNGSSGSDVTGDGSSSKPYKTIGKAIDKSSAMEFLSYPYINNIYISSGTYNENIYIGNKRIRFYLQGNVTISAKVNTNPVINVEQGASLQIDKLSSLTTNPNLTINGGNYSIWNRGVVMISNIGTLTFKGFTGNRVVYNYGGYISLSLASTNLVITATSVTGSEINFIYSCVGGCAYFVHTTSTTYTTSQSFASGITTKRFVYASTCGNAYIYNAKISNAWSKAFEAAGGGRIAIRGGTISAGTQYTTTYGGRIYSGAQASVPSY